MSKAALRWFDRQHVEDGTLSNVLQELSRHHFEGQPLFPSQRGIAERIKLSPRAVWSSLKLLEHFGLIGRAPRFQQGKGRTSDAFTLTTERDFTITRAAVRGARRQMRPPSHIVRAPLAQCAKENQLSNTTGLSHERNEGSSDTLRGQAIDAATPWPGFAVIAGGRN